MSQIYTTEPIVSILVLLEFCLWGIASVRHWVLAWSFNPCFIGILSVRFCHLCKILHIKCFNPCFIGILSVSRKFLDWLFEFLFQSLFYWNSVCEIPFFVSLSRAYEGFNPCFIGILSVSIWWCAFTYPHSCFNPCFIGILSVSAQLEGWRAWYEFQSLFYWNSVCETIRLESKMK